MRRPLKQSVGRGAPPPTLGGSNRRRFGPPRPGGSARSSLGRGLGRGRRRGLGGRRGRGAAGTARGRARATGRTIPPFFAESENRGSLARASDRDEMSAETPVETPTARAVAAQFVPAGTSEEVIDVLTEQLHRYMQTLLSDAHDLTTHCGRTTITAEDVRLAETLASHDGYGPRSLPTHDVLMDLARQINAVDLPLRRPRSACICPIPSTAQRAAISRGGDARGRDWGTQRQKPRRRRSLTRHEEGCIHSKQNPDVEKKRRARASARAARAANARPSTARDRPPLLLLLPPPPPPHRQRAARCRARRTPSTPAATGCAPCRWPTRRRRCTARRARRPRS